MAPPSLLRTWPSRDAAGEKMETAVPEDRAGVEDRPIARNRPRPHDRGTAIQAPQRDPDRALRRRPAGPVDLRNLSTRRSSARSQA